MESIEAAEVLRGNNVGGELDRHFIVQVLGIPRLVVQAQGQVSLVRAE